MSRSSRISADAARALLEAGADPNALDAQRYDIVTIAAVADDVAMLKLALARRLQGRQHHQPL